MRRLPLTGPFSVVCLLMALWIFAPTASAGEVHLDNGDRISGEIVSLVEGTLTVATDYAGEVEIDWARVVGLASEEPLTVVLEDETRLEGTVERTAEGLRIVTVDREGAVVAGVGEVVAVNPPEVPAVRLKGHLTAALAASSGNTESDRGHLEGRFVARTDRNRFTLTGAVEEAREDGRTSASRTSGGLGYDHFVSEHWYWSATATLTEDELKDLALRTAVAASAGYQVYEGERTNLALEAGASYVHEDFETVGDESYPAARWALDFDHDLLADRLELFHRHELLASIEDSDDLLAFTRTGLRFSLFAGLLASVQLHWDHDESPAPGRQQDDTSWLLNLGYQW